MRLPELGCHSVVYHFGLATGNLNLSAGVIYAQVGRLPRSVKSRLLPPVVLRVHEAGYILRGQGSCTHQNRFEPTAVFVPRRFRCPTLPAREL